MFSNKEKGKNMVATKTQNPCRFIYNFKVLSVSVCIRTSEKKKISPNTKTWVNQKFMFLWLTNRSRDPKKPYLSWQSFAWVRSKRFANWFIWLWIVICCFCCRIESTFFSCLPRIYFWFRLLQLGIWRAQQPFKVGSNWTVAILVVLNFHIHKLLSRNTMTRTQIQSAIGACFEDHNRNTWCPTEGYRRNDLIFL